MKAAPTTESETENMGAQSVRETIERTYKRTTGFARCNTATLDELCVEVAKARPRDLHEVVAVVEQVIAHDKAERKSFGNGPALALSKSVIDEMNRAGTDLGFPDPRTDLRNVLHAAVTAHEGNPDRGTIFGTGSIPQPTSNGFSSNPLPPGTPPVAGALASSSSRQQTWTPFADRLDLARKDHREMALIDSPEGILIKAKRKLDELDHPWPRDMAPALPTVRAGIDGRERGEK